MCGIFATVIPQIRVRSALDGLRHRGPDGYGIAEVNGVTLGAVRLAIQDLSHDADQPFVFEDLTLAYNGELWNADALREELSAHILLRGYKWRTTGDTEVVAAMLWVYGTSALELFEGMFAVAWTRGDGRLYAARDRFGEVPLHVGAGFVSSELKAMPSVHMDEFPAACFAEITSSGLDGEFYYSVRSWGYTMTEFDGTKDWVWAKPNSGTLRRVLDGAVRARTVSDAPLSTLLSGGLDSAAVAASLKLSGVTVNAYTAVMDPKSPDLRAAREVAEHLGMELIEVPIPVPTAEDLANVVNVIEMPYKAQVEIGWACLKLAEVMRADGVKVTFSGEGSDELWASYGFSYHGIQQHGWYGYRRRAYAEQSRKNFPRANKAFMAHGIEVRLPFCHTSVVELALSCPQEIVQEGTWRKAILGHAYEDILPERIIKRAKVAFQDALGLKKVIADTVPNVPAIYKQTFEELFG